MRRREFLKCVAAAAAAARAGQPAAADVPDHLWSGYDFGPGPRVPDRLNQGPFGIEQDDGWYTVIIPLGVLLPAPAIGLPDTPLLDLAAQTARSSGGPKPQEGSAGLKGRRRKAQGGAKRNPGPSPVQRMSPARAGQKTLTSEIRRSVLGMERPQAIKD